LLPNYIFTGIRRSNSKKGGIGFFYRKDLQELISVEEDLSIFEEGLFESIFLKIRCDENKGKETVVGVIYLPTGLRNRRNQISQYLDQITQTVDNKGYECVLVGDMNIDLLKYGTEVKVGEYVDQMVSSGFKFRLIQPTRVNNNHASLIDHVLDNLDHRTATSGVITTQLRGSTGYTDHFPVYTVIKKTST
jgi:endonuclease/exonuclease/phosphatase family metal-dependent hydrolase